MLINLALDPIVDCYPVDDRRLAILNQRRQAVCACRLVSTAIVQNFCAVYTFEICCLDNSARSFLMKNKILQSLNLWLCIYKILSTVIVFSRVIKLCHTYIYFKELKEMLEKRWPLKYAWLSWLWLNYSDLLKMKFCIEI